MDDTPVASAAVSLTVTESDLAPALGSGDVPVLGTPRLIALFEEATVAATEGLLEPGETTVGTSIEVSHSAPSPLGARVQAVATLEQFDRPRLSFAVEARQGGKMIGAGHIQRAVVDRTRFLHDLSESE